MPRSKQLSKAERDALRLKLAEQAAQGALHLPETIKTLRAIMGLNQEGFGRLFKLTRRQVHELEAGTANPTLETLNRLGRPFGLEAGLVPRKRF
ncbi:helix-turn-helix transcriptional regulator [Ferrovibrio sp. MS7]|jgi:putative transcriptional regulator|uniref:helix-turn-helix transcriptional regulator n=1 Tax=Ferrovibrio plantarum TaxID=3119164 RepID=UPI003136648D